jgi:DNA-binding SARP family transcriptional activator
VREGGRVVPIERPLLRALLAYLLLHANQPVSGERLIDELWGHEPSRTASASLQNYVSRLRKTLGPARLRREAAGYVLQLESDSVDLIDFQRLVQEAEQSEGEAAATRLREALALWRGEALAEFADEPFVQARRRLEELRLAASERRIDLDLSLGRHKELVPELEQLVAEHPLRERLRFQLMLALYRAGRQADALDAYRAARSTLVEELGIEPASMLRELEHKILRQAPELDVADSSAARRAILVAPLQVPNLDPLLSVAELLAQHSKRELIVALLVDDQLGLDRAVSETHQRRAEAQARGTVVRAAAFTSRTPADDLVRLAAEQDIDLLVVDAPPGLLEDPNLATLLARAPCDVAVMTCRDSRTTDGPILVPFGGAEHDWSAIEVAAWFAAATRRPLLLAGPTAAANQRDASRLLATASLAVDRALGIAAKPLLVEPSTDGLLRASEAAGLVVIGLSPRWQQRGLGAVRAALAERAQPPALLIRQGLRPGGLAPAESLTRFTWSIAPAVERG